MSKIIVKQSTKEELELLGIDSWGTWTCEVSRFNWEYDDKETCYFYEGEVVIEAEGEKFEIKPGDLVIFSKGLKCVWNIKKPVRKVYNFG
ncbi:MAG TPA: cupin domain-containing protein [Candidatus Gastranaerophilales bacterium]|nr:cupin domain-containing protein [Candidatus Gastranaerophilales bacterium]